MKKRYVNQEESYHSDHIIIIHLFIFVCIGLFLSLTNYLIVLECEIFIL